jgi:anaphase-promoting complex subunit 1
VTIFYGRLNNPDWKVPFYDPIEMAIHAKRPISFEYGRVNPLEYITRLNEIYLCFINEKSGLSHKRAERAISHMVRSGISLEFIDRLPLGLAAPLREAARTCQIAPPTDWPIQAYAAIGRDDVSTSAYHTRDVEEKDGYISANEIYVHFSPCNFSVTMFTVFYRVTEELGEHMQLSSRMRRLLQQEKMTTRLEWTWN